MVIFTGCVSGAHGSLREVEYVNIDSTPSNAQVRVFDGDRMIFSGNTPTKVRFYRGSMNFRKENKTQYRVLVSKSGYEPKEYMIQPKYNGVNIWDIGIGLGMVAGGIAWNANRPWETKINDAGEEKRERKRNGLAEWTIGLGAANVLFAAWIIPSETTEDGRLVQSLRPGRINARLQRTPGYIHDTTDLEDAVRRAVVAIQSDIQQGATVAVLSIASNSENVSTELIDMVTANLFQTRRFPLVSRSTINILRQEQNFQLTDEVDDRSAIELGRLLGSSVVITGRVTRYGRDTRLILQAIHIESAQVVSMAIEDSGRSPLVRATGSDDMIQRAINKMYSDIPQGSSITVLNIASPDRFTSADLMDMTMLNLHQRNRFNLVNRQALNVLRTEQDFQFSREVDHATAVELGRFVGAGIVLTGKMTRSGNQDRLILQALDTETACVVSIAVEDETRTPNFAQGLDGAIRRAVNSMEDRIPAGATVAVLNIASNDRNLSSDLIDVTMHNLHQNRRFTLVNRSLLNVIRSEQNFQFSIEVDDNTAIELGRLIGARVVVTGRFRDGEQRLILQALDTQTAQVLGMAIEDVR
jgi:curli biogenesis system outer membrane secretion channel CsgG